MLAHENAGRPQDVLAANLRRLRIARRLSLSELARATGMSKATLSSVESGRSNPTIETLASLAAALRVSLGELLEEPPLGEVRIVRHGRHGQLDRSEEAGLALSERVWGPRHVAEPDLGAAGARAGVYVLEGKLIAGPVERVTELAPGDYASFPIDVPHVYETERTGARALVLTYGG
ncbi:MAG TPA: XRE family transcriptional regulator [Solirubrobacteraceae bacterium]|nr:XRE family transcriptional regulator [Solirubrobacteraceae bacterium]